jgi:N6-L-threonylcarbamoyladenine synthase
MKKNIKILAIETSCDETAVSVIGEKDGKPVILSSVVNSQIDLHAKTGGVVPEVASRAHMEAITPVISEALIEAFRIQDIKSKDIDNSEAIKYLQNNITHIAVTNGPGLIGSLLVGFNAAKAMAYTLDKPIIPVNHIEGHIYSAFAECHSREGGNLMTEDPRVKPEDDTSCHFPVLALTVSGGHTSLTVMRNHGEYERIGGTIDDAAGEAFDKVAKLLGLGYPGGPIVSKLATQFRNRKEKGERRKEKDSQLLASNSQLIFPRPILNDGTFNFSFSGLKTAVLQKVLDIKKENYYSRHPELARPERGRRVSGSHKIPDQVRNDITKEQLTEEQKQEICAAFEDAVVDVLVTKAIRAVEKFGPKAVVLAGGVAANNRLRSELESRLSNTNKSIKFLPAPNDLTGDNAAMIGLAAFYHLQKGNVSNWENIEIDSNLELGSRS